MMTTDFRKDGFFVPGLALLLVAGFALPGWMRYLLQVSLAEGLVALAVMIQMRAGLVSFGQGLYYALGAYLTAIVVKETGIRDIALLLPLTVIVSGLVGAIFGTLLSRYREIFFAMLTMALSMIFYGVLVRSTMLGSTDGFNVAAPSYFGFVPRAPDRADWSYGLVATVTLMVAFVVARYLQTAAGSMLDAVAQNEIRLDYLGTGPRTIAFTAYVVAAICAGTGGLLHAITARHVDPELTNWTTSGGFVFIALLAGRGSVVAPILGAFALALVKTYALGWAPNAWQLILGAVMLLVILTLPNGLWSLIPRRGK